MNNLGILSLMFTLDARLFLEEGPTLEEVLATMRKHGYDALVQDVQNRLKTRLQAKDLQEVALCARHSLHDYL